MSEQMREEFSAWYLAEVTESYGEGVRAQAQKNLDWVREDGSFADPMLRLASLAWQASRESLVVELPKGDSLARRMYGPQACGANPLISRFDAIEAIEVAGPKVKP